MGWASREEKLRTCRSCGDDVRYEDGEALKQHALYCKPAKEVEQRLAKMGLVRG